MASQIQVYENYNFHVFLFQILKKYQEASAKKITFENFLRALAWVESAATEDKIRGTSFYISTY